MTNVSCTYVFMCFCIYILAVKDRHFNITMIVKVCFRITTTAEISKLRQEVRSAHGILHKSILTQVSELRHSIHYHCPCQETRQETCTSK